MGDISVRAGVTADDQVWLESLALRFYQRRGYRLVRLHAGAVDEARRIKPAIPEIGEQDIPIHDEIELEKSL
ncbi:MAG: hypothetical protein QOF73_4835 [Thermomicrobiales bacterium]|nr:hypothetical protein [Thermomicrobiales bacterium]